MKKTIYTLILILFYALLSAAPLGKLRFVLGEVHYRDNQNSPWKEAKINQLVDENGQLKTGPGSTAEILWNNNLSSTVAAKSTLTIKKLFEELSSQQKWVNQVKDKVSGMSLQKKQQPATVAGIRREEAQVEIQTELFWDAEPLVDITEAIALYEDSEFEPAIPLFLKVIEQGPLKKDAEIAHSYLILIYEEQKDTVNRNHHIRLLKTDFPTSVIIPSLPLID